MPDGSFRVERESATPLYVQVANALGREIAAGQLAAGSRLGTEEALMRRFDVSRVTLRGALTRLAQMGVVESRQGKGTFVAGPVVHHGLDRLTGFYDAIVSQGFRPRRRLLAFRRATPEETGVTSFATIGDAPVFLRRLYVLDGKPFAVVQALLLPAAARVTRGQADSNTIYQILAGLHIDVARADIAIRARTPGPEVAKLLGLPGRSAALVMERESFDRAGHLLEHSLFFIVPEAYEFRLAVAGPLHISPGIKPRPVDRRRPDSRRIGRRPA
jgi:GntR family transcriptional regulator